MLQYATQNETCCHVMLHRLPSESAAQADKPTKKQLCCLRKRTLNPKRLGLKKGEISFFASCDSAMHIVSYYGLRCQTQGFTCQSSKTNIPFHTAHSSHRFSLTFVHGRVRPISALTSAETYPEKRSGLQCFHQQKPASHEELKSFTMLNQYLRPTAEDSEYLSQKTCRHTACLIINHAPMLMWFQLKTSRGNPDSGRAARMCKGWQQQVTPLIRAAWYRF